MLKLRPPRLENAPALKKILDPSKRLNILDRDKENVPENMGLRSRWVQNSTNQPKEIQLSAKVSPFTNQNGFERDSTVFQDIDTLLAKVKRL